MPRKKVANEIVFVLDKSGSMGPKRKDAIGGFNQFLEDQKKLLKSTLFTMAMFDSPGTYKILYDGKAISDIEPLDEKTYIPSGMTALLDAIGRTIDAVSNRKGDKKVIFAILTDGLENSSQEYNKDQVLKLIEEKQKGGWEFIYLGCQKEAIAEAVSLGIPSTNTMYYADTGVGTLTGYRNLSNLVTSKTSEWRK